MAPTLIVILLLVLGVAVVAWAVRRQATRPYSQRNDQDTAWNDPVTPTDLRSPPDGNLREQDPRS